VAPASPARRLSGESRYFINPSLYKSPPYISFATNRREINDFKPHYRLRAKRLECGYFSVFDRAAMSAAAPPTAAK